MFSCAPYLLIVVCLAFFRAGSENLPTCVFQVRFSPRKHGVRGNECQKRSVVSVWYAQNSLPFCTEVWYTTLTSCEDPTKMLMRVCTLFLMQPAPLTGTATSPELSGARCSLRRMQPAPLTGTKKTASHKVLCDAVFSSVKGRLKAAVIARPCAGAAPSRRGHRRTPARAVRPAGCGSAPWPSARSLRAAPACRPPA